MIRKTAIATIVPGYVANIAFCRLGLAEHHTERSLGRRLPTYARISCTFRAIGVQQAFPVARAFCRERERSSDASGNAPTFRRRR